MRKRTVFPKIKANIRRKICCPVLASTRLNVDSARSPALPNTATFIDEGAYPS